MPRKKKSGSKLKLISAKLRSTPKIVLASIPEEVPVIELPEAFLNEPIEIPAFRNEAEIETETDFSGKLADPHHSEEEYPLVGGPGEPLNKEWNDGRSQRFTGEKKVSPKPQTEEIGAETERSLVKVGDYVFWESGGVLQFKEPRRVTDIQTMISDGRRFAILDGASTGVPVEELRKSEGGIESGSVPDLIETFSKGTPLESLKEVAGVASEEIALNNEVVKGFVDAASSEQAAKIETADSWDELYVALREIKELRESPHGDFKGATYSAERLEQLIRAFRGELSPKGNHQKSADGQGISERYIPRAGGLRKKVIELRVRELKEGFIGKKENLQKPKDGVDLAKKVGAIFEAKNKKDIPPRGNSLFQKVWGIFRRGEREKSQRLAEQVDKIFKKKE